MFGPFVLLTALAGATTTPLRIEAESFHFARTGRYDEAIALCRELAERHPGHVRCENFGTTPEGRPLLSVIASNFALSPEQAREKKVPVVLAQGGIHAGEIDGKDAGFLLLRDLLETNTAAHALDKIVFVFVPIFNVDGHERFGPNHRPNQRGPDEVGWRVTSQNLNLNRDYVKADTAGMQAMIRLLNRWDPIVYLDLHVTDGAKFEPDVSVMIDPSHQGPEPLRSLGTQLERKIMEQLKEKGHIPLGFYPAFENPDDPMSGFRYQVGPPRFSNVYWASRNRFGVLVETHSWRPYAHRVQTTKDVLAAFLEQAQRHGSAWLEAARNADASDLTAPQGNFVLRWKSPEGPRQLIDFPGYEYKRETSEVSGKLWVQYDESKKMIWKTPFIETLVPDVTTRIPKEGYLIPAGWAKMAGEKLILHGFSFQTLTAPCRLAAEIFQIDQVNLTNQSFEGRQPAKLSGKWIPRDVDFAAGSLFVPAEQKGQALLVHLMDALGPDSLGVWGFSNSAFEQKEYVEDYVLEPFARSLMKKDPSVRAAFEDRLQNDPAFAKDPSARLHFFAVRHPSWDSRISQYPIARTDRLLNCK